MLKMLNILKCKSSLCKCPPMTQAFYRITCIYCNLFYIGSTISLLHQRIREHSKQSTSSFYQYNIKYAGNILNIKHKFSFNFIGADTDKVNQPATSKSHFNPAFGPSPIL